ncbi:MAG: HEAT repeat domain-containing protein [Gemmataceae bacterium]|nr:HEAT repeat domain-containing protein [Gemmataceae bacterium]
MHRPLLLAGAILAISTLLAQEPAEKPYNPKVSPASDEPSLAMKKIRVPKGFQVDLWAAEPLLANPVCLAIDEQNRIYVAETFRLHAGVTDICGHMNWLDDDLASRTVEDRVTMLKKYLGKQFNTYETDHDRIRLLEDTKGGGKADRSAVYADGFHNAADGIGSGLLARRGNVWFTCIPDLWLLRDTKGTGKADERRALQTGYGVHVGYLGHDLHGLRMGPDGKLYFSIGDRGLNVKTENRTLASPDTGAVLRCNPDGSDLELVATGLRNPQELAFDQYGNLFTGDNNADGGDKARWVYVVEGGDSGWRIGYQFLQIPGALGPWNAEKLWHPAWDGQAAYIVPPIANVADGPSGLTYYPGVGLPDRYKEHFFLADFRGSSGGSGVRSFAVKPKGTSFELFDSHEFIWSTLATDVEFGMDGALYVTDWTEGWGKTGKGRIWKVSDPDKAKDADSTRKLMAEGFTQRPVAELTKLLEHADIRVRQEAQFALADKGSDAIAPLTGVARGGKQPLARLHAVWGLGQVGRKDPAALKVLPDLLADADAEVRAQAARAIGDARLTSAFDKLLPLLKDPEGRVRFFATMSIGKLGKPEAVAPVLELLRAAQDKDPYLRHAGVMALVHLKPMDALIAATKDDSIGVRMAALVALRRLESPEVARFLSDGDPRLVLEAARAINDVPINAAMPQLAKLIDRTGSPDPLLYRVLNAHFRLGQPENARALAAFAARKDAPEALRLEALRELSEWAKPSGRDRIVGLWRPLETRSPEVAAEALRPALGGIFSGPDKLRQEAVKLVAKLGVKDVGPSLLEMVADKKLLGGIRAEALQALDSLKDSRLTEALEKALGDGDSRLTVAARRIQARVDPETALRHLATDLSDGKPMERQAAFATLAEMNRDSADALLASWFDRLLDGKVSADLHLDLLEAAAKRGTPSFKEKLAKFESARPKNDHLGKYRETMMGGDAEAGRRIFLFKAEVSCVRCHKLNGNGGEVGPELTGIAGKQTREYLLESLVDPNKQIAKGFETVVLLLRSGKVETGVLKSEDGKEIKLITAEGKLVTVLKDQIDERNSGKSAMPEDVVQKLTKRELRDLVEFLAGLK